MGHLKVSIAYRYNHYCQLEGSFRFKLYSYQQATTYNFNVSDTGDFMKREIITSNYSYGIL